MSRLNVDAVHKMLNKQEQDLVLGPNKVLQKERARMRKSLEKHQNKFGSDEAVRLSSSQVIKVEYCDEDSDERLDSQSSGSEEAFVPAESVQARYPVLKQTLYMLTTLSTTDLLLPREKNRIKKMIRRLK